MKRKVPKKSKRRLAVFGTLSVVVIVYALVNISYYGVALLKVKHENNTLETELKDLQNTEENLRLEIQKLKDPEYIARYARENYFYSKDGEKILKLENDKFEEKKEESKTDNNIYIIIIGCCVGLILIVMIMKKRKPASE